MVDFRTKKLENLVNQLNNQTIRIGSKTGQEVKLLSIFNKEIEITEQNKDFLSFFNTQKDNKIDSEELAVLKKVLVDYAREDKILTKEEFLEIFGKKPNSPDGEKLFTDFQKFVTSQSKVSKSPITEGEKDENVTEDFNADGSGTRITKKKDKLGNDVIITEEFGAGKILTKKTINGKNTIVEQEYKNNAQGKPVQIVTTNKMSSGNIIQSNIVELKYDDKGNIIEKNTTFKNDKNQIISVSQETMKYNDQNKISEKKTIQKKGNKITKNTVETITYNSQGKVQSKKITAYDNNNKIIATNNVQFEYDTNGKLKKSTEKIQEKVTINNQTKIENKNIVTTYNEQGKISHRTTSKPQIKLQNGRLINTTQTVEEDFKYRENGTLLSTSKDFLDDVGKPYHTESHYAEDGMREISCDKTFYKRGVIIKQHYEGPNLDNRKKGGLPSTSIEYETDGRTVKQKIVNEFDSEGIFIGQKIYDKNDKLTASYDFSKIDGTFEIARQVARGDCYLMATINSFASTPDGQNILKNNVSITTDANGKKVYTIKLPGSKIAREALINGSGNINVGKLPADKVFIQESYTITEDELHAAMLQSGSKYSAGDKDVLLYEVAFEKYRNDLKKTIDTNHIQQNHIAGLFVDSKNGDNLSGGLGFEPMFIISGKKADSYINKDSNSAPVCYVDSNYQLHLPDEDGQINTKAITMTNASNNERKVFREMFTNGGHTLGACFVFLNEL